MRASNRKENLERFLKNNKILNYSAEVEHKPNVRSIVILISLCLISVFSVFYSFVYAPFSEKYIYQLIIPCLCLLLISLIYAFNLWVSEESYVYFFVYLLTLIFLVFMFGVLYATFGTAPAQDNVFGKLEDGIYLSFMTWTTIGFGDVQPVGYSRVVASIEGIFSYISMAFLVAWLLRLKTNKENAKQR